jgi:hypothetical protein
MPWFCNGCGRRRGGTTCKKECREAIDEVAPGVFRPRGETGAERIPPLDGMIFFNDDGSGVPRYEQQRYDNSPCKRGIAAPRSVQGPRPQGWKEAMRRIGERCAARIKSGPPEC